VWFFLIFLGIYGSAQAYIFVSVWRSLKPHWPWLIALGAWLLLMLGGPFGIRLIDNAGYLQVSDVVAPVVYTWMAATFWLVLLFAVTDLYNAVVWLVGRLHRPLARFRLAGKPRVIGAAVLVSAAIVWGLIEARSLSVEEIEFSARLPADVEQIRIVQVSDVHLGLHIRRGHLDKIVEEVEALKPDVLISTGDMVDGSFERVRLLTEPLARVGAPLGKYAILGNHEFYVGVEPSLEFHRRAGFHVLRAEARRVVPGLWIAGVDDTVGSRRGFRPKTDESDALADVDEEDAFVILLKHRPHVSNPVDFDLQLSGHTHGGQIWPWHYITATQFPYVNGLHKLAGGAWLHVNRGTGTWGPQVRLFARPEITVITIVNSRDAQETQ
jgi:hypothetical protein